MRMITQDAAHDNEATSLATLIHRILAVLLLLTVTACSQDGATGNKTASDEDGQSTDCKVTSDASAWSAFKELADRIAAKQPVSSEDLKAYGIQPSVTVWRNSFEPNIPPALRVGNWLEATFWDELGREGKQKLNPNRATFMRSYRYSLENRNLIDEYLAELTGPRKCEVADLAGFWIEPDRWPEEVTIHFLPARPEIRIFDGSLLVDTGLVGAAPPAQVIRSMAGLLYRKYQFIEGPNPIEVEGEEAVANMFRVMMNEGLASWIEMTPTLEFDPRHWKLSQFKVFPEQYFNKTQNAISLMNDHLGSMFADHDVMVAKGQALATQLGASNLISQVGYGMAAVVAARFGEEYLRDAGRSVPAFLTAYQEAASQNADPVPVPGDLGVELFETVPPLQPEIFTKLQALLISYFSE